MFWNKKEDNEGLPDLPPLQSDVRPGFELPNLENETSPVWTAPSFPESPMQKAFPQPPSQQFPPFEEMTEHTEENVRTPQAQKMRTMEMDEWTSQSKSSTLEEPPMQPITSPVPQYVQAKTPEKREDKKSSSEVFVKIEKFNSARRALNTIKQKLDDVDVLLRKIRETKMREEQELISWEKELSTIKSRIQDVNTNIFD